MIRMAVAGVLGFVLVIIESMIVLHLRGYETIDFGGMAPFVNVWAMNFFLVYSILTQVTNWYVNREGFKEDNSF
ncbi:MAG TPA: hypothetical protein VGI04_08985 [Neobacillus sp.]|jgi:hypothetical protein